MLVAVAACGHPAPPPALPPAPALPRLLPPLPADPGARGATYLAQVALQLQPGWGQFLEDCRLRLPPGHPLNRMALATTAELAIDARGRVVGVKLDGSGDADFDRAVRDAIDDAAPFAPPPADLVSDDDLVHLRWLFARDRRQAGPATAQVVDLELPLAGVVARRLAEHDLARAARRIARAPRGPERTAAIAQVMTAALREALGSADAAVRRAAVDAIRRAGVRELAPEVREQIAVTSDTDLRLVAIDAAVALEDRDAVAPLARQLRADVAGHLRLALAEVHGLVRLGAAGEAIAVLRAALAPAGDAPPNPVALDALAEVFVPELAARISGWLAHGDARTRAGACAAAGAAPLATAVRWLAAGLRDPDATVRGSCLEAAAAQLARHPGDRRLAVLVPRLRELARDRDRVVRARAVGALVELDGPRAIHGADDPAAEVRAAFAAGLAAARDPDAEAELAALADDRDPDVRAAAWTALAAPARAGTTAPADRARLAAHAASDASPQVRLAAVPALDDDAVLAHLAAGDDSPEVQTEALVALAGRRGRTRCEDDLLAELAAAPPGGAGRVRAALAWLLAR